MAVMNTEAARPAGRRGRYPKEFRRDAAALVIDQHRTIVDVAKELGIVEQTLGNWFVKSVLIAARDRAPRAPIEPRSPGCSERTSSCVWNATC